jgi:hypothetical protein
MFRTVYPEYIESGISGPNPTPWFGVDPVDGDAGDWIQVGPGSDSILRDLTNNLAQLPLYKQQSRDTDADFTGLQCICEKVLFSQFTDGASTSGTYALKQTMPVGAFVLQTVLVDLVGFTGDTTATIIVGDGTDTDRYSTGTPSVFTTAAMFDVGVPSGLKAHIAAKTVTITITSGSDWGLVVAGSFTIKIFYLR